MFKTRKGLIAIVVLLLLLGGGLNWPNLENFGIGKRDEITVSPERRLHILTGDERGGGHRHGAGRPCKSEFPKNWNDEKIISTAEKIAANDNVKWEEQDNGYYTGIQMVDGVRVRVVLDRERDDIVTAYPLNLGRNDCPRSPANDNLKP